MNTQVATILMDSDPILREVSEPVTEFNQALVELIATMVTAAMNNKGQGLAAVQIGIKQRVIVVCEKVGPTRINVRPMINPVFLRKGNRFATAREGCLSIPPHKWCDVSRPAKCEVEYQDPYGNKHTMNFSGQLSRVVQHEMDHLDGILITDKPKA